MSNFDNNNQKRIATIFAADFALKATCQLYQYINEESGFFKANGCVVLFEYNSMYYCFSNAHVLADKQLGKTFFLLKDGTAMSVGGDLFHSEPIASERRENDYLDIAIVKLNSNVTEHLKKNGHVFLKYQEILTGANLTKGNKILIAGYPASKTKVDLKTMRLKFNPLIVTTIPYLKKMPNKEFSRGFHHLVEFPIKSFKETSTSQKMRAPQPHGISGSGVWLLDSGNKVNSAPTLIGIFSEYHENRAVLIGTKIDLFIDLLKQKFDASIRNYGIEVDLSEG